MSLLRGSRWRLTAAVSLSKPLYLIGLLIELIFEGTALPSDVRRGSASPEAL